MPLHLGVRQHVREARLTDARRGRDVEKHSSKLEASVARSTIMDGELSELHALSHQQLQMDRLVSGSARMIIEILQFFLFWM